MNLIGFRWAPGDARGERDAAKYGDMLKARHGEELVRRRGFRLFLTKGDADLAPLVLAHERGIVLGSLFENRPTPVRVVEPPDEGDISRWCASGGAAFMDANWGDYVAVLCDRERDRVLVMRSPSGARPVFLWRPGSEFLQVVFTALEDLLACGVALDVDRDYVSGWLLHPRRSGRATAICDIEEVLPGEALCLERSRSFYAPVWTPPESDKRLSREEAALRLRASICKSAEAVVGLERSIVHRLSGGLDSSLALSALKQAGARDLICVTEVPRGFREGDEREAARRAAGHFGAPWVEIGYDPKDIQYERLLDAPIHPRPSLGDLSFADANFLAAIGASEAPILTSGQGGDQIFGRLEMRTLAAEARRDGASLATMLDVALEAARAGRTSVWPVLWAAFKYGGSGGARTYLRQALSQNWPPRHASATALMQEMEDHPWVRNCADKPASALRAMHWADLAYYRQPTVLSANTITAPLLTSQPVLEAAASIPPYLNVAGGCERALARLAFASLAPPPSLARRAKGDTTRFAHAVARHNAGFATAMLKNGKLAEMGLFEASVEQSALGQVTRLVAELWMRRWEDKRGAAKASGSPM
jgi:asparagine synthase (glutamine-hydrolysing)